MLELLQQRADLSFDFDFFKVIVFQQAADDVNQEFLEIRAA